MLKSYKYQNLGTNELFRVGAVPYNGGLHSGHQLIEFLLGRGYVEEAWEVLTSEGPKVVFKKEGEAFFIDPGSWIIETQGDIEIVKKF